MNLTKEQIEEAKLQLKSQIQHLPENKKKEAEKQIESLSSEAIEEMLRQQQSQTKIFRMIVEGKIPSVKIDESPEAIAVLSVKSVSKGHSLIIPKEPIHSQSEISKEIYSFSEKISKRLIKSLKAKQTKIIFQNAFGEVILNIIPIYDKDLSLSSPVEEKTIEELEEIKKLINVKKIKPQIKKIKMKKKKKKKVLKLNRRIP